MTAPMTRDAWTCDECGARTTLPVYWTDETGDVRLCSPGCAERAADTSPR